MSTRFRWFVATLGALFALTLVPGTATATEVPKWVQNPASCTNVKTVAEKTSGSLFVQLRRGWCGRGYYVWARANGNRVVQLAVYNYSPWKHLGTNKTQNGSGNTHYTQGRRDDSSLNYFGDAGWGTVAY